MIDVVVGSDLTCEECRAYTKLCYADLWQGTPAVSYYSPDNRFHRHEIKPQTWATIAIGATPEPK